MLNKNIAELEKAWDMISQEPTVWDQLEIKNSCFYYKIYDQEIFLSSFKNEDLPTSPYPLTFLGRLLTKLSVLANILSRRPGTEEVTFYALLNSPQSGLIGKKADKKMLEVASPPLVWRREQIKEIIRNKLKECTLKNESFFFLDIGSGAGFDSLEIERIVHRFNTLTSDCYTQSYKCLNIDIDEKWLNNNKLLTKKLFGLDHHITIDNSSVFDFFEKKYKTDKYDNLIISCNGFAEFLTDVELEKLYIDISKFTESFEKNVEVILPFANKNKKQEALGKKIGFKFNAKEKEEIFNLINKIFINFEITSYEQHSHIVMKLKKLT